MATTTMQEQRASFGQKLHYVNWGLLIVLCLVASIGFAMLYSAANGSADPWAWRQTTRFATGLVILLVIAMVDLRLWLQNAYWIYFGSFLLLVYVELAGQIVVLQYDVQCLIPRYVIKNNG